MEFEILLPLQRYLDMGGILQKEDSRLRVIESYPAKYLGKRKKLYTRYREEKGVKMDHYKVEYLDSKLYPKGHIGECFLEELHIKVKVSLIG